MGRTAFFCQDRLTLGDTIASLSEAHVSSPDSPYTNALDDRPRLVWQAPTPGYWSTPATYIDINEGSGEVSVALPPLSGNPHQWATMLQSFMSIHLTASYTVTYEPATAKFTITASGASTFNILWSSGTHGGDSGDNVRQWLGWERSASDTGLANSHTAPEKRYGTNLFVTFDLGSAMTVDAAACILDAGHDASINDGNLSTVKFYGNATQLSAVDPGDWETNAAKKLTFSPQPSETQNKIQVAHDAAGAAMSYRYWAFSWQFFDEDPYHAVGMIKALKKYASADRQITELSGHGLTDPTTPLGIGNYYPSQSLLRWVAPLNFNAWGATDYNNVVRQVVREGSAKGLLWALRWDEIAAGTHDAEDEADKGFLLWGAITSYGQGSYSGAGSSDFISGELTIEQVR